MVILFTGTVFDNGVRILRWAPKLSGDVVSLK